MTNTNMPIVWQNALDQFQTEIAKKAWVWFAETRGEGMQYAADQYAGEVEHLVLSLSPMLAASKRIHEKHRGVEIEDEVMSDLLRFMLIRHANWRLGGNITPDFLKVENYKE